MQDRIRVDQLEPASYKPMIALEQYLATTDIEPSLKELIKVKASIINKCAYCIQMHTEQARSNGETEQRLYALTAWQESPLFSEKERAVLALTEEVTLISEKGVTDATYSNALKYLGENGLAQCIMQIVTINAWNRIALSTKMYHPTN
ncbi:alkylhydroperoxidase [Psychromonas sp. CNPT3]|uniref:carboxymuconolactone decarboxylase family protein n=1 Tax=Psychromonas sp. CNPT3 TaxID=314282 RepID=UPI00006E3F85|nr:carboxymuconolactone decarboxylase family protein [Psychromonas sp. CNPT3]AGH81044.1 alkylhydroperoxidase [Psychromonas sp. CNPT3]